jgi:hypothetical protein
VTAKSEKSKDEIRNSGSSVFMPNGLIRKNITVKAKRYAYSLPNHRVDSYRDRGAVSDPSMRDASDDDIRAQLDERIAAGFRAGRATKVTCFDASSGTTAPQTIVEIEHPHENLYAVLGKNAMGRPELYCATVLSASQAQSNYDSGKWQVLDEAEIVVAKPGPKSSGVTEKVALEWVAPVQRPVARERLAAAQAALAAAEAAMAEIQKRMSEAAG